MKAKKHLVILTLALTSTWAVAGEVDPTATIAASAWTAPHNHSLTPTASVAPLVATTTVQRAETTARATTGSSSQEDRSNGRLMLIGVFLIGVIALRSRKNIG
jgi:PBP1b-binding outer membrane lipoprotein LpoB